MTNKPNIIVFFTDQQRWDTSGLHGNPLSLMDNFDRSAQEGTHIFNSFSCQPVCGPARASFQTGMYATKTGNYRNHIALDKKLKAGEKIYYLSPKGKLFDQKLAKKLSKANPDIEVRVDKFYSGPPVFAAIDYAIKGDDPEILQLLGEKLELIISKAPNISSTNAALSSYETNIEIDLNNSNMALSSKQMETILIELAAANNGIVVGSMLDGNKELSIKIRGR